LEFNLVRLTWSGCRRARQDAALKIEVQRIGASNEIVITSCSAISGAKWGWMDDDYFRLGLWGRRVIGNSITAVGGDSDILSISQCPPMK
jgi:hypothetical protein